MYWRLLVFYFLVVAATLFPDRAEVMRRIEVELLRGSTKVSERDVEKRKGVLAWRATYEQGETRTIKFGYAVSYPDGEAVPGF